MLEKHAEYLASLKDPEERVKAQLDPLFSDMEAFKVRNFFLLMLTCYELRKSLLF